MVFLSMELWSSSSIIVFFLSVFIILCTTEALVKLPRNETVPAVLVFGDSIVDPGNNNNLNTLVKSNFPPYGRDLMGGVPTGRFSNGKIPSDFIGMSILFFTWPYISWYGSILFPDIMSCFAKWEIFIFGMFWKRKYRKQLCYRICLVLNYVFRFSHLRKFPFFLFPSWLILRTSMVLLELNKGYPNQTWSSWSGYQVLSFFNAKRRPMGSFCGLIKCFSPWSFTGLSSWAYVTRMVWDFDFHNFPNRLSSLVMVFGNSTIFRGIILESKYGPFLLDVWNM